MLGGEEVFKNPLDGLEDEPLGRSEVVAPPIAPAPTEPPQIRTSNDGFVDVDTNAPSSPGTIANDNRFHRTEEINVDLDSDNAIMVDISDALSEKDKVKYTVHTKTRLPGMRAETSVVREHEEFLWLHSVLDENESYAGFIVPPAPPRPDFDSSREKLQKLGEGEATMTKEEFTKMKQELEQDYLAQFKKTVAMHEVFLQRIAAHPVFRQDSNFRIFLQYEDDKSVRIQPRNVYLFDDGRCRVRRLVRDGISDFYLEVITCRRCTSRMKITLRHGKYRGEMRPYWTYRCQGCQSYRSLMAFQNQSALNSSKLALAKRESKPQVPVMNNRYSPIARSQQSRKSCGFLIFIPKQLSEEEVMILSVRGKNKKEVVESLWKRLTQSADEVLLSGQRDVDDFFENERNYLVEYNTHIKDAAAKAEKVVKLRKNVAETYAKIGDCLERMARVEPDKLLARTEVRASDGMYKLKKVEARSANDEELKLTDTLSYYTRDTQAAKDLLYRRLRCLANYEAANKNLERARGRNNKDIPKAEHEQQEACKKFEDISALAKTELKELKKRRVLAFKKNLAELADLEIKHAKAQIQVLNELIGRLKQQP
ncbi:hypothetical protein Q1695_002214 [Nippostrongylus brasiliensis]|nr:hypothetical protein Q1695_002214 [Nippostrongylus brasiliensis]